MLALSCNKVPGERFVAQTTQARKKKWAPRSRTGCKTCRIRRIRCDQGLPFCKKCTSTGRKCDGYELREGPCLPRSIGHQLPGTDEEKSHFHFFASTIVLNLPPLFDFGFWESDILKASNAFPALFHASAAMGAVHHLIMSQRTLGLSAASTETLSHFLLRQFNQSIKHVQPAIQTGTYENKTIVLAACIVYICLSAFQGRQLETVEHIQSGIRILHSWNLQSSDYDSPVSWETLFVLLTRLDTQVHCLYSPIHEYTATVLQAERVFLTRGLDLPIQSFWQVYSKIELLCNSVLRMTRRAPSRGVEEDRNFYSSCLDSWNSKLCDFLEDFRSHVPVLAVISCRIRILFTAALLKYDQFRSPSDYFNDIVQLAASMLENDGYMKILYPHAGFKSDVQPSKDSTTSSSTQPMTLTAGFCEILYFVAVHCRETGIRRQAIHLLKAYPHKEGICDTALLGDMAKQAIVREEPDVSHEQHESIVHV